MSDETPTVTEIAQKLRASPLQDSRLHELAADAIERQERELEAARKGLRHPQIHLDFYDWMQALKGDDKDFVNTSTRQSMAMFVWTRARETLRVAAGIGGATSNLGKMS